MSGRHEPEVYPADIDLNLPAQAHEEIIESARRCFPFSLLR